MLSSGGRRDGERMPTVLSRFTIKHLGSVVVVLNERAKRGDIITDGVREWMIRGVETFAIMNPGSPCASRCA